LKNAALLKGEMIMENKGLFFALQTTILYPFAYVIGVIAGLLWYPISIFEALFDPNTP
jgi:hypothetical protein